MKLTEEQRLEMSKAAKPLMDWIKKNAHPHATAIVDFGGVELLEGVATASVFDAEKAGNP